MPYEARYVAVTHFYAQKGEKMPKKRIKTEKVGLEKHEYMLVKPDWCNGKIDGWEAIVDRWVGNDEKFNATSSTNSTNRGSEGTHLQGSRNDERFHKHLEVHLKRPVGETEAWALGRQPKKPKEGAGLFFGKSGINLEAYTKEYQRKFPDKNPMSEPIDEEVALLAGTGRQHGRLKVGNSSIKPTSTLTQVRASNPSACVPPRAQPRASADAQRMQERWDAQCSNYNQQVLDYNQQLQDYHNALQALNEYKQAEMDAFMAEVRTGTSQPPLGPRPSIPPLPMMPTMEEGFTSGTPNTSRTGTPRGSVGSSQFFHTGTGVDGHSTPGGSSSPYASTPIWDGQQPQPQPQPCGSRASPSSHNPTP